MECLSFPLFITWNITSNCNLRCKHCFRTEYEHNLLTNKKIDEFINLFIKHNVEAVILTGGEPLTSKKIFYILKKLQGKIKVGIATNGILLTEEMIKKLLYYNVKSFQISLDGASASINDYIRGNGVFNNVIRNIKKLQEYHCDITLAMTVNSFNYEDILNNSLYLIEKLKIKKFRIEYYIPVNKNEYFHSVTYDEMTKLCNTLKLNKPDNVMIQFPKFDSRTGCGAGIYNCILNSDLTISPCDLLTHKYRSKPVDNIELFQKFWLEDLSFIQWRRKMSCFSCENKYKCLAIEEVKNE